MKPMQNVWTEATPKHVFTLKSVSRISEKKKACVHSAWHANSTLCAMRHRSRLSRIWSFSLPDVSICVAHCCWTHAFLPSSTVSLSLICRQVLVLWYPWGYGRMGHVPNTERLATPVNANEKGEEKKERKPKKGGRSENQIEKGRVVFWEKNIRSNQTARQGEWIETLWGWHHQETPPRTILAEIARMPLREPYCQEIEVV